RDLRRAHHPGALPGDSACLNARGPRLRLEATRFRTVSAVAHIAPAARPVATSIEEDPLAGVRGAFLHPVELCRGKDVRRGAGDLPERPLERIAVRGQGPAHTAPVVDEPLAGPAGCRRIPDQREVSIPRRLARRDRGEDAPDRLAERDPELVHCRSPPRILFGPPGQTFGGRAIQAIRQLGEADDIGVAPEVVMGRLDVRASDRGREIERESAPGKLDVMVGDRGNVAHLTAETTYRFLTG